MAKHSYQDFSPLELGPAKRIRTSRDVQQYTEAEQWFLQGAAKILKVRPEDLLTVADTSQLSSTTPSTPESRHTPSAPSLDDQNDSASSSLSSNSAAPLWVPTMSGYEHSASPATQPIADTIISRPEHHPNLELSKDIENISSMQDWLDVFPSLDLPSYETAPALDRDKPWDTFNDASVNLPSIDERILDSSESAAPPSLTAGHEVSNSSPLGSTFQQEQLSALDLLPESLFRNSLREVATCSVQTSPEELQNNYIKPWIGKTTAGTKGKRKGPFQDQLKRDETALTRKYKACISCRMQHIRCHQDPTNANPEGICKTCIDAAPKRIHWIPCLRLNLSNAELLDHGVCPRPSWTKRFKRMEIVNIQDWDSADVKTIHITQDVRGQTYGVKVRRFKPREGDALERRWKTCGVNQSFKCAPYAIADMDEAGRTLSNFADRTLGDALYFYIDKSDPLLQSTYEMAYKYAKNAAREEERLLMSAVLRLWCASRMESRSDRICGEETLGMEPQDYGAECPNTGIILTPPVFSAQLEVIVVSTILRPAKKEALKRLFDIIQEKQRRSWLCIYLCIFILLHNCALATASANKRAKKQGYKTRYFDTPIIKSLHHGAKVLLAYFHFYNRGSYPFTMDWLSADQIARAEFNTEEIEFMRETTKEINKKASLFSEIKEKGEFEHSYYFLSQLFEVNWTPRDTI